MGAVLAASVVNVASAQPTGPPLVEGDVTLEYHLREGAAGCPGEAALRERAADAFDFHDPFVERGRRASAHLRVEISGAPGAYRGAVSIVDDAGATLTTSSEVHADCDALVWVLGHRVALAIVRRPRAGAPASPRTSGDASPSPLASPSSSSSPSSRPGSSLAAPSVTEPPVTATPRDAAPSAPSSSSPVPAAPRAPGVVLEVATGGLFTAGFTSDVGPGVWLAAAARRGWFSIGVEARGLFPAVTITYEPGRSSYATTLSGLVVPCVRWKILAGCAFAEVGSLLFTIPGHSSAELSALVALGPRAVVDLPLAGGLSVRVFGELALHPYLPVFHVRTSSAPDARTETWVTPIASGLFAAGLVWAP